MITKEFIEETDKVIKAIKAVGYETVNGNVFIAKPILVNKTTGGIDLPGSYQKQEMNKFGFGRILSIPSNLNPEEGDANLKVGDYMTFVHEAQYKQYPAALELILGVRLGKAESYFFVQDNEVTGIVDLKDLQNQILGVSHVLKKTGSKRTDRPEKKQTAVLGGSS